MVARNFNKQNVIEAFISYSGEWQKNSFVITDIYIFTKFECP